MSHEDFLYVIDCDGNISTKELGTVLRALGQKPTEAELSDLISEIDKDNSGTVDFQQFLSILEKKVGESENIDEIREAFRVFDKDGKGTILTAEMKHVMTTLGEKLNDDEIEQFLSEADPKNEGVIHYEDFIKVLMNE